MRIKRMVSIIFAFIIAFTMGKLLVSVLTPPVLPVGAKAPQFEYKNTHGEKVIFQSHDFDIVMFFNTACEHCVYQLELLNANIETIAPAKLYLMTPEENYQQHEKFTKWKHLNTSGRVIWGTTRLKTIKQHFGNPATPSFYIFQDGRLKTKFYGEVKLERLVEMLKIKKQIDRVDGHNMSSLKGLD
ncbi:redoxin domain-containing protein [candidate division KSB1 bacterium]|nr:redoxin domain-containing protein [candidate division KSB1 bacterium]